MSIHNQYANISLTESEIRSLSEQFDAIRAITDTLQEIDPIVMRHVPKMGKKTQTFSRDTFILAAKRQHLLPRGLDLEAIEELFKKRDALQDCLVQAKHLARHLELLLRLVGSDLFSAALAAYKAMKTNDRNAASDPLLKALSLTFSRTKKPKKTEAQPEEEGRAVGLEASAEDIPASPQARQNGVASTHAGTSSPSKREADGTAKRAGFPAKDANGNENNPTSTQVIPRAEPLGGLPAGQKASGTEMIRFPRLPSPTV